MMVLQRVLFCSFVVALTVVVALAADVEKILQSLSLRQKIAQMAQLDIANFYDSATQTIDYAKIESYVKTYEFGSMLNSIFSSGDVNGKVGWNATEWRFFINKMQTYSQTTSGKIPIIYGIDSIHGASYIYESAMFPQCTSFSSHLII